jgi:hypothetical protein
LLCNTIPYSTFWGEALADITTITESLDIRRDRRPKKMFSKTQVSFTVTKVTGKGSLVGVGQNGCPTFYGHNKCAFVNPVLSLGIETFTVSPYR